MEKNRVRRNSFLQSFVWVGVMLLAMGAGFMAIAAILQLVPISPDSINVYSGGVRQPPTEETVRTFRLIFLLTFGIIGLCLAAAGIIIAALTRARRRRDLRLKEDGRRITAQAADYLRSAVRVNSRYLMRLSCSYDGPGGKTYIFKSGLLRRDPSPYLADGKVTVYHDRDNIGRYYVDVDGSAGLGTRTVEL